MRRHITKDYPERWYLHSTVFPCIVHDLKRRLLIELVGGHDSAEDAIACMELMMWKIKQDLKQLK